MVQLRETLLDKFTIVKVLETKLDATVAGEFRKGLVEFYTQGPCFSYFGFIRCGIYR